MGRFQCYIVVLLLLFYYCFFVYSRFHKKRYKKDTIFTNFKKTNQQNQAQFIELALIYIELQSLLKLVPKWKYAHL